MSANANRRDAGSNRLSLGGYVPDSVEGTPARTRWCNRISAAVIEAADASDKAAGIYRVSLDAAVEAAAIRAYEIAAVAHDDGEPWADIPERDKQYWRDEFGPFITAAVMGGAQ